MICKKCGAEFDGAFCPKCGERAEEKMTVCPVCGKERAEGENFCSKCGYAFEGQAKTTQKPQAKITFDKEALIGGVRKFYKAALNISKVFFSLLLLFVLASPIMLHEGINTAGSGYTNAFNLYVDGRFTAVCAILMIIAFYSFIYGLYSCVKFFVFRNKKESKTSKLIYFAINLTVFIVCCIGCSGAGEWFADAGAGLSFGIFVGIVGMALSVLRYLFEDKFVDSDGAQSVEVSDDVKAVEKKAAKGVKLGTAVVTGALVVTIVITSIVQGVYTNPFSSTSYDFAETRADVIKQFGMPENAKTDSSSYTYYSTEYVAAERMIDALIAAQDKQLTEGFESDADSFDEDDLESMFDGAMGIESIIEKLEEKQDNIKYKKSVVTFNNDGGDDRSEDTVKSYVCEVVKPEVEGEEKEERTLTKLKIKNGYYFSYDGLAELEYFAKYSDGSFSSGKITLNSGSFDEDKITYLFSDTLGEYTVSLDELETIEGEVYVRDGVLYIAGDTSNALANLSSDTLNKIRKIEIKQGVTSVEYSGGYTLSNLEEISAPDSLVCFNISIITDSKFYNDVNNWENGNVLYIGNFLAEAKDDLSGDYTVREGTTAINENAFSSIANLKSITIPDSVMHIGENAFKDCKIINANIPAFALGYISTSELKTVVINSGNSIGSYAFSGCSSLTSITIPDSVTSIGSYAFDGCGSLTSITIPDSVTSIGSYAFSGCKIAKANIPAFAISNIPKSYLRDVVINSGESIDNRAFEDCSSLTSITIPDSVTSIGYDAFDGCGSLKAVYITDIEAWCNISFSSYSSNPLYCAHNLYVNGELVTELEIPDSVTSIGSYAFRDCSSLTSITIPSSVTSIGDYAFYNCSSLTSITIPDSLTSIGSYAFCNCSSLTSITIPDSVTSIGSYAFDGCGSLTSITIPDSVTSIGSYAFSGCKIAKANIPAFAISDIPKSYLRDVVINSGESIDNRAFEDCSSLTSITIPDSVTSIGYEAFYNCSSLTSITIPDSVTSIGTDAFYYCSSLTIYCKAASKPSGWGSYWNNGRPVVWNSNNNDVASDGYIYYVDENGIRYALKEGSATVAMQSEGLSGDIEIPSSISYKGNAYTVTSIGSSAFYRCSSLTSITIPSSVTSIGDYAFRDCSSLTSITIPDSLTSIGSSVFYNCSSLTSITIPDSVTSIGSSVFYNCSSLEKIEVEKGNSVYHSEGNCLINTTTKTLIVGCKNSVIPDDGSVTSIGSYAFYGCSSLTSIMIPSSVTSIGSYAFYGCSSLTSIIIPDSVTSIGSSAFSDCSSLTSITIPSSVTSIGSYAFDGCGSLKAVYITDIAAWCNILFSDYMSNPLYCDNLYVNGELVTELEIPDSVTSIGSYAFYNCSSLTSITIPDSVTSIGSYAFRDCSSLTSITIPSSVTSIGYDAFDGCGSLKAVYITDIEAWCNISFSSYSSNPLYCDNLYVNGELVTELEIPDSVTSIGSYAFRDCSSLTSITIPSSVTSIGDYAFYNCSSLEKIEVEKGNSVYHSEGNCLINTTTKTLIVGCKNSVIPDDGSVTSIGSSAFSGCSSLTSITIPDSVTSIGDYAFSGCSSLTIYCKAASKPSGWGSNWNNGRPVVWNSNNNDVASDGYIYYVDENGIRYALKEGSATVAIQSEGLSGDIEIPSSISYKGNAYTVTSIGSSAFYGCSSLTSITIPDSVTSIGSYAFRDCGSLTSIIIPDSVTSIGSYAFDGCGSLKAVYITDIEAWCNISFSSYSSNPLYCAHNLYVNGELVTELEIPDSVTSIGSYAFRDCSSLTSITIPDSVTSIGYEAFYNCSSLTSITIPDSVTSIGNDAFYNCSSLTSVIFENTQDWWRSWSSSATSSTSISSSDLADPATAATFLKSTYRDFYWKRG